MRTSLYSDAESFIPDKLQPEGFGELVCLLEGDPFTRTIRIGTLEGNNSIELPSQRRVLTAVMQDQDQYMWCEPYNPEWHGEIEDTTVLPLSQVLHNPDWFDIQQSLINVLKSGSSKPAPFVERERKKRGADPSFKLPKQVYSSGKLK